MRSVVSVEPLEDMIAFFSHFHWRLLRDLAVLYLAFAGLVYLFQRKLQYFPDPSSVPLPHDPKYRGIETVNLTTTDGLSLFAWHWPGRFTATLVMFHGNAGHRGHRLEWIEDLHRLGYGVFALDYRGYGGSKGSPSEEGLYRDGEATLRWLRNKESGISCTSGSLWGVGWRLRWQSGIPRLRSFFSRVSPQPWTWRGTPIPICPSVC